MASSRARVNYSRDMAGWRGGDAGVVQGTAESKSPSSVPKIQNATYPTLGVTFCTLVMILRLPSSISFSTCPYQLSVFVDSEGSQLGSTLDPKERDVSKRNHCAKALCEVAWKDQPSGGKNGVVLGNGAVGNGQDKQTLL